MKSYPKVLFAAIFIAQAFFKLSIKAAESLKENLNMILSCKDCK